MMKKRSGALTALILAITWICGVRVATAQQVVTTSEGDSVVVDGNLVRIRSGDDEAVVSGDWRHRGTVVTTGDADRVLVELGAVTTGDRIQVSLEGDILFDFDSTKIQSAAAAKLAQVAQVIRARSVGEVYVIGHTDSVGSDDYNLKLSRDRAVSVMRWLNRREGIPPSAMVGSGLGSKKPIAHNTRPDGSDDPAGRARNRRVEIQIATREGVALGPDVTIGPDSVTVGEVKITEAAVDVGGVRIDTGGVSLGGRVTGSEGGAGTTVVDDENPAVCGFGKVCTFTCREGDCRMTCSSGAVCTFSCPGGDCTMICESGGTCNFSCSGGDCSFKCPLGSTCNHSCTGGDCGCTGSAC